MSFDLTNTQMQRNKEEGIKNEKPEVLRYVKEGKTLLSLIPLTKDIWEILSYNRQILPAQLIQKAREVKGQYILLLAGEIRKHTSPQTCLIFQVYAHSEEDRNCYVSFELGFEETVRLLKVLLDDPEIAKAAGVTLIEESTP